MTERVTWNAGPSHLQRGLKILVNQSFHPLLDLAIRHVRLLEELLHQERADLLLESYAGIPAVLEAVKFNLTPQPSEVVKDVSETPAHT
jgi:hypothetical protein